MGPTSDRDETEVVELLGRDVVASLGTTYVAMVQSTAKHYRQFDLDRESYVTMVVEDFQQYVHDCFIDTVWPACPVHPKHPMWFQAGYWVADGIPVARLGELGRLAQRRTGVVHD
jgi:hypothetical protein